VTDREWRTRAPEDVVAWLDETAGLPWPAPFTFEQLGDRLGWQVRRGGVASIRRPNLDRLWQYVSTTDRGAEVTSLSIELTYWTPAEGTCDDPPAWLPLDTFHRVVDQVAAHLGAPPDAVRAPAAPITAGYTRFATWYRDGFEIEASAFVAGGAVRLTTRRARREPDRGPHREPAHAPAPVASDAPADWAGLGGRLDEALARLHPHARLVLCDRRGGVGPRLDADRERRVVITINGGTGLAAEAFGADPAALAAAGWGPTGLGAGAWRCDVSDPGQRRAVAAACAEALRLAGCPGPADLVYQSWYARYPNGGFPLAVLGLPWRPAPAWPWRTAGTGDPLPTTAVGGGGRLDRYDVLVGLWEADSVPVALSASRYRTDAGWEELAWNGSAWAATAEPVELVEREPTEQVVAVDRLTAERVALMLTGAPLPP
jgi:hypothetical protein